MKKYCKAYKLKDFRQFKGWYEKKLSDNQELSDDDVAYLWDDFTVVKSPVYNESVLFENITPEWKEFCKDVLNFKIPEDLRYSYRESEP